MADSKRSPKASQRAGRISAKTGKPIEKKNRQAERAAEFYDHLKGHYRQSNRAPVAIPADIKLLTSDGKVFDAGTATVMNVSPSGALLGDIKLPKNCYPAEPFTLEVVMKGGDYEGIGIEALPVRFEHEFRGIGVKFLEIFVAV
jgi:hypothetical protein